MKLFPQCKYGQKFDLQNTSAMGDEKMLELNLSDSVEIFRAEVLWKMWSSVLYVEPSDPSTWDLTNSILPIEQRVIRLTWSPAGKTVVLLQPYTWKSIWEGVKRLFPKHVGMLQKIVLCWSHSDGIRESRTIRESNVPPTEALDALVEDLRVSGQSDFRVRQCFVRLKVFQSMKP